MSLLRSLLHRSGPDEAEAQPGAPLEVTRPSLIVGLGNPGQEYARTRHNVGVWTLREIARRHPAKFDRHGKTESGAIEVGGRTVHLARPRAYMNVCGPPIAAELRRLKLKPAQMLVIYDDLDLPVGQVRIRLQGGHGGNNGMRSIIGALGGGEFPRIRIGIDRPYDDGRPVRDPDRVGDWVLGRPSEADRQLLEAAARTAADAALFAAVEGVELAMNRFNV
jgi:PTH1 family peptidyl-tRNA hydrolase